LARTDARVVLTEDVVKIAGHRDGADFTLDPRPNLRVLPIPAHA
jgi:hypothetical protein